MGTINQSFFFFTLGFNYVTYTGMGFPGGTVVKNLPASAGDSGDCRFDPWIGTIPWRRKLQPTPVFLPGKFHGRKRAWWATVHGVAKSGHDWSSLAHTHTCRHRLALGKGGNYPYPGSTTTLDQFYYTRCVAYLLAVEMYHSLYHYSYLVAER